jgi:hypothetical protein
MSVASCPLCVLHAAGWSNAACCRSRQHVGTLHVVGSACCMVQCCPLHVAMHSAATYLAVCCIWNWESCLFRMCNADRCMLSFSACCTLQCCPLHPILLSVASGILNPVVSARCSAVCCMHAEFMFLQCCPLCMSSVASYPLCVLHVAGWSDAACCRMKYHADRCLLSVLPVACRNAVRCNLSCCLLHLEF